MSLYKLFFKKMFPLFFLTYFKKYTLNTEIIVGSMETFGFDKGANFSVTSYLKRPGNFFFGLMSREEQSKVMGPVSIIEKACNEPDSFVKIHTFFYDNFNSTTWTGTINETAVLRPILINCREDAADVSLELRFSNPNSLLDNRWYISLKAKIATLVIIVISSLFCLFNIIKYWSDASWFSILVFVSSLFTLMGILFSFLRLKHNDISDEPTPYRELYITAHFFSRLLIYTAIILGSNGWGILNNIFDAKLVIKGTLLSTVFFTLLSLAENVRLGNWDFIVVFLLIIFLVLLVKSIIVNITESELSIKGHLYVISQNGIDPSSTPTYKKLKKYKIYKYIVITYIFCVGFEAMALDLYDEIPYWFIDLVGELTDIFIVTSLSYLFRMTDDTIAGYEEIESASVPFGIAEGIGVDSDIIQNHSLKQWEVGMSLPPMPNIIDDAPEENAAQTIEANNEEEHENTLGDENELENL